MKRCDTLREANKVTTDAIATDERTSCDCCNGTGMVTTSFVDDFSPCMNCNGSGRIG